MAKAILKFDLTDPDDVREFEMAAKAKDFYLVLWQMDGFLRDQIKYHDKVELQPVRDKFFSIMRENDVDLDSLA